MPPHNQSVAKLSREAGVSVATLYNWKKQFRAKGYIVPKKSTIVDQQAGLLFARIGTMNLLILAMWLPNEVDALDFALIIFLRWSN